MLNPRNPSIHKFLHHRIVFVGLPISEEFAQDVLDALAHLMRAGNAPITVYINSPGGSAPACEKIICGIEKSSVEIWTCCLGLAAGGAAHIFLSGRRRFATPQARVQFTLFRAGDLVGSPEIDAIKQRFVARTSRALGVAGDEIEEWMIDERCFNGPELIEKHFAEAAQLP